MAGYILTNKLDTSDNREVQAAVQSMRKLTSKDVTPVLEQLEALGWLFRGGPLVRARRRSGRSIQPSTRVFFPSRCRLKASVGRGFVNSSRKPSKSGGIELPTSGVEADFSPHSQCFSALIWCRLDFVSVLVPVR